MPIPSLKTKSYHDWRTYGRGNQDSPFNKKHKPLRIRKKTLKTLAWIVGGLIIAGLFIIATVVAWVSRDLPNPNQLINRDIAQSTKIFDRTGEKVLYEISGDEKRTLVAIEEIPDHVKKATIALEDKNFYNHGGFSLWAMFRTALTNVVFQRSAGGSTLTQQFIKNAVLTPEKKITRKIKELVLSYRLEKKFSKDEILQMYLNEIPYGSNAYGVEAASQKYFGKSIKDVSLEEAAVLAAIIQLPSRYSPYGPNKDLLLGRKDYVLKLMVEQGYVSEKESAEAQAREIIFKKPETNIKAPHFVMYIKDILAEKYGEKTVERGGLKIYTTLDLYKQEIAEQVITEKTKNYPEKYGANNASLVSIDPKTGQILVMVGSRDYFDDSIDGQVNVSTRARQPGSSIKPMVYAALFEKGYTPNTILFDCQTNFSTNPAQPYEPNNYSGNFLGPVSIRKALAGSLNIPAVKAIYLADVNNVIDLAESAGYSTLYPRSRFGLALVLGGAEVKLLEHTNAYSTFARDGLMSPVVGILKVEDKDGNILEEYEPAEKKVMSSQTARMINSILSDNEARSYVFGIKNNLVIAGRTVAAKTGTTNDYHDAWTIGYTPSLVTGVWVGNNDNKAMTGRADGSVIAAPIWKDYMTRILGDTPAENFKAPDDYKTGKAVLDGEIPSTKLKFNKLTGQVANEYDPSDLVEERDVPIYHNILYYVNRENPREKVPENPETDPQFNLWETGVKKWMEKNASSSLLVSGGDGGDPALSDPKNKPIVNIISPAVSEEISTDELVVKLEITAPSAIERIEYYINDNLLQVGSGVDTSIIKSIDFLPNGYHKLRALACNGANNCGEATVDFKVAIKDNLNGGQAPVVIITSPQSGLALSSYDFPLPLILNINPLNSAAQVNLIIKDAAEKTIRAIKVNSINSLEINTQISEPLPIGAYTVYAEAISWGGSRSLSAGVQLLVN